jgi:hypothetical protein
VDLSRMNQGSADFELTPEGVHNAVCYRVVDLGTQEGSYMGKPKIAPKIMLSWEIDERMEDGRRFAVHKRYTASMHEKAALRKDLEAWRGKPFAEADFKAGGFKMEKLLGAGCQVQIVHTDREGRTYANIAAIMKLGKGMKALEAEIEPFILDLDAFDRTAYDALSEGLKETIAKSPEFQAIAKGGKPNGAAIKHSAKATNEVEELDEDIGDSIPF